MTVTYVVGARLIMTVASNPSVVPPIRHGDNGCGCCDVSSSFGGWNPTQTGKWLVQRHWKSGRGKTGEGGAANRWEEGAEASAGGVRPGFPRERAPRNSGALGWVLAVRQASGTPSDRSRLVTS